MEEIALEQKYIEKVAQKGRDSLFFLARGILGFDKITAKIHKPLCRALEDYVTNRRLKITLPRDWYKTTLGSICYPIWRAINDPEMRILLTQNTFTNAVKKIGSIKQIVESNKLFRLCYPKILPVAGCKWSADSLCLNRKGAHPESTFEAAGTDTAVVSRHYDLIIEDDTVAPKFDQMTGAMQVPTQAEIEKCIGWHKLAIPLLIEPVGSQILVIGTRWCDGDLLQYIDEHENYVTIERSCREDENGKTSPIGKPTWIETDNGVPKFTEEVLTEIEGLLGPYMFAALYLNNPTAAGDQLFKSKWITYFNREVTNLLYCTSIDPASAKIAGSSDPDYNVITTTGLDPSNGHVYIVRYDQVRANPGEVIELLFEHHRAFHPIRTYLEAISYQRTLEHWIVERQKALGIFFNVDLITSHSMSKEARIRGLQPYFANNRIFLHDGMGELETELLSFPYGKHDDIIDSLAMQIPFWQDCRVEVKKKYERKYVFGSASFILDKIQNKFKKYKQAPYDMGLMKDRIPKRIQDGMHRESSRVVRGSYFEKINS